MDPLSSSSNQQKPHWLPVSAFVIAAVLVALFVGYYFIMMQSKQGSSNEYQKKLNTIHAVHHSGDHSEALRLEEAALTNLSPEQEAHIRAMMAFDYIARNQPGDMDKGMQIYKDILANTSYSVSLRALVTDDLATLLVNAADRAFYEKYLNVAPYKDLLPAVSTDDRYAVQRAALKMFKLSDEMYPNSLAKLSIVSVYGLLITTNSLTADEDKELIAAMMQDYISQADPLIAKDTYEASHLARQYLFKAMGLGVTSRILNNVTFDQRENAYKQVLAFSGEAASDYQVRAIMLQARFFYASFLYDTKPQERLADIKSILLVFGAAASNPSQYQAVEKFFLAILSRPDSDLSKKRLLAFEGISSEFKAYIAAIQN